MVRRLAAVIFDFDGVMADTEPLHHAAFQRVLEPLGLGLSWADYTADYLSFNDRDVFRARFRNAQRELPDKELHRLADAKGRIFRELLDKQGVAPLPGVVRLVRSLTGLVPLGICTGALPEDIQPILKQAGIAAAFDVVVTAREVHASKPDPTGYRLALQRLAGAFPARAVCGGRSVAIEDSPGGITAARAAGLHVLAVSSSYPVDQLAHANLIVPSLEGVGLRELVRLMDRPAPLEHWQYLRARSGSKR